MLLIMCLVTIVTFILPLGTERYCLRHCCGYDDTVLADTEINALARTLKRCFRIYYISKIYPVTEQYKINYTSVI